MPQSLNPIGIILPIKKGNSGYFNQSFDTVSQVKSNIINLLRTRRGERRFQPFFGSGLINAIFEQNLKDSPDILKQIVINDINAWIPNITVIGVDLSLPNDDINNLTDIYTIHIQVKFMVNNVTDSVNLILQENTI
jgi:phage baseplate assembly protein W